MSEKFLFIVDSYEPTPSSNGVCIDRLWKESQKIRESHLLALTAEKKYEKYEDNLWICHYKRTPASFFNRLFSYAQDDNMVVFLRKKVEEFIRKKGINTVVCTYRPIENLICGIQLKRIYGDKIRVIPYYLDNLTEITSLARYKSIVFLFHQKRLLKKSYKYSDNMLVLRYYKNTMKKVLRDEAKNLTYVGIPGIIKNNCKEEKRTIYDNKRINLVYTGSFYAKFREPEGILCFLKEVCKLIPELMIHLYSWGCEDQIKKAKAEIGEQLVLHGRVSAEDAYNAITQADCLFNVGNDLKNQVPGKLFEYFSTGKPIINFVYREDDPAKYDYERYGNIFLVKKYENNSYEDCAAFIRNSQELPWETVKSRFEDCEPIYTVKKIIQRRFKNV